MNRFDNFKTNKPKYNKCNNYLKASFLCYRLAIAYFNDCLDILQEFGLYTQETKQSANFLNKAFDNFYKTLTRKVNLEAKFDLAKDFDVMRAALDDIFDSEDEIDIETVQEEKEDAKC